MISKTHEIRQALALPSSTSGHRMASRAINRHAPGGSELADLKEWATGLLNFSSDPARREVAEIALGKIVAIQAAMLRDIERQHDIEPGALIRFHRTGLPD